MCFEQYFESISLGISVWVLQEANAKVELKVLRDLLWKILMEGNGERSLVWDRCR